MKRTTANIFGFLLAGLAIFSSCEDNTSPGNFSVATPVGWARTDTLSKDGSKRVEFTAPFDYGYVGFIENISVSVIHTNNSLDRYSKGVLNEVQESAVYFEKKASGDLKINGYRAKWVQALLLHKNSSNDEKKEQKVYFIKGKDNIYMIVCSATRNGIIVLQDKIDEVINSFKVVND